MQSVSELTEQIKSLLETTFLHVKIQGEVSRPTYHSSGHLYFTLKDDKASISCVMFRGNNQKLKFRVEEGMSVHINGSVSVYSPRGSYQINCVDLEPAGSGALALAYEQLKKELLQKGYFEQKRQLPRFPSHIALVTSKTGAALQDMLKVATTRWPLVKITLINTLVQGADSSKNIAQAIRHANTLDVDIIVLGRGGGSVEDLWVFNEKEVAEAVYKSKIPTVSAVGHAIDTVISDFVADKTAPTPSAAMEMILPDINEMRMLIDTMMDNYLFVYKNKLHSLNNELHSFIKLFNSSKPTVKIKQFEQEIFTCKRNFRQSLTYKLQALTQILYEQKREFSFYFRHSLNQKENALKNLILNYEAKNPKNSLKKGYAQILKEGKSIDANTLKENDIFELQTVSKKIISKVLHQKNLTKP